MHACTCILFIIWCNLNYYPCKPNNSYSPVQLVKDSQEMHVFVSMVSVTLFNKNASIQQWKFDFKRWGLQAQLVTSQIVSKPILVKYSAFTSVMWKPEANGSTCETDNICIFIYFFKGEGTGVILRILSRLLTFFCSTLKSKIIFNVPTTTGVIWERAAVTADVGLWQHSGT